MMEFGLIYPMVAMVALTFVVLVALFRSRTRAVGAGEISVTFFRTYQGAVEPESTVKLSRHFANIFEAPTLFYIACLAAMIAGQATVVFQVLAWLYVGLRAIHALVHTGGNRLRKRIAVYFASWIVLLAMWLYLAAGVALSGLG